MNWIKRELLWFTKFLIAVCLTIFGIAYMSELIFPDIPGISLISIVGFIYLVAFGTTFYTGKYLALTDFSKLGLLIVIADIAASTFLLTLFQVLPLTALAGKEFNVPVYTLYFGTMLFMVLLAIAIYQSNERTMRNWLDLKEQQNFKDPTILNILLVVAGTIFIIGGGAISMIKTKQWYFWGYVTLMFSVYGPVCYAIQQLRIRALLKSNYIPEPS